MCGLRGAENINNLKSFFDIIIEMVKETVKRVLKIVKQLVLSLTNCVRIIVDKKATSAQKADSVSKLMSATVSTVVIEVLFECIEKQFKLSHTLMEPIMNYVHCYQTSTTYLKKTSCGWKNTIKRHINF